MTTPQLIVSIIYFIVSLALVAIVMLQSGKSAGLSGAIAGGEQGQVRRRPAGQDDQMGGHRVHGPHPGLVPAVPDLTHNVKKLPPLRRRELFCPENPLEFQIETRPPPWYNDTIRRAEIQS